jgi:hypothetical protein
MHLHFGARLKHNERNSVHRAMFLGMFFFLVATKNWCIRRERWAPWPGYSTIRFA